MVKKLSTYQRLKQENMDLKQELYILVGDPDSHEAMAIKLRWNMRINLSKIVWRGSPTATPKKMDGLMPLIIDKPGGGKTVFIGNPKFDEPK